MKIKIEEKNVDKLLQEAERCGRSPSNLVNFLVANLEVLLPPVPKIQVPIDVIREEKQVEQKIQRIKRKCSNFATGWRE